MRLISTIQWCLSLSWKTSAFYTIVRIAGQILKPIIVIVASFLGKYVIDILAGNTASGSTGLISYLIALFAIAILRSVIEKVTQYCQVVHDDKTSNRISLIMMNRLLSADLEYFDNPEYQDKMQTANRDSHAITSIIWNVLSSVSATISFLAALIILCRVNFLYGSMMLVAAIPSSIAAAKYTKVLYDLSVGQINALRQMSYCQSIASDKYYAQDLRLYNAGNRIKTRYSRIWENLFTERKVVICKRTILTALSEILPEAVLAFIGINLAYNISCGKGTVGDYSFYTGLAMQLWSAISMLSSSVMQIYDNQIRIENIKALDGFKNHVSDNGNKLLERIEHIEFNNVCFAYPGTSEHVLRDISFNVSKGEKVALVGLNGSGKTTLIKLILRLYEPSSGFILINGLDIREYQLTSLRAAFSIYFQDMRNFYFTLRENFTLADEGLNDSDTHIESALHAAYASDIIAKSSKGLETSISRVFDLSGIELSGGQHQKLSLARAFYRRHSALILDEPSSNLDPKAEHEIFNALQSMTNGKLTIFTSHRLSNVSLADRIIVLEKGRIVEEGTQKELLALKQKYAELFRYQQERYMINEDM